MTTVSPRARKSKRYTIYALIDPRDQAIRYIGITEDVYQRMRQHSRCEGVNAAKNVWIQELQKEQLMFIMHSLEKAQTFEQALEREQYWIQHYLQQGANLTNIASVPEDPFKPRVKVYKPYQIEPKTLFFQACTGRTVSVWRATNQEFDAFIKQYTAVEGEDDDGIWQPPQRRHVIARLLNDGVQITWAKPVHEDDVFIKRGN